MKAFTIPAIFTAIDKLSGPIKKMEDSVSTFAARSERKFRKIGEASANISKNAFLVGAAIAIPLSLAANSAMKFEEKMSNVATLVDTNKENMQSMGEEVLSLATKLPIPIDELTTSLYDIRSAGISADKAMGVLETSGKLSAAGLATASEATNIMTSAINAFASENLTAGQISDTLFKTVKAGKTNLSQMAQAFGATAPIIQSAGVKLADFSAATAALTTVGTPAAQAQNQIRAAVISMQKPTEDMTKIFAKLGVKSGPELIKKTGGLVPAMEAIESQGKKMGLNMAKALVIS
jgi:TP901 family phage tail tape measure protein